MTPLKHRFRGFLPVVVDVETGGFDPHKHALLEVAAVILGLDDHGQLVRKQTLFHHIEPFEGSKLDAESLAINGIKPFNPLRLALKEKDALDKIFRPIRAAISESGCKRAVLVGHNAHFDLSFLKAAVKRTGLDRDPFHDFSVFDTVTLSGVLLGQTALARALQAANLPYEQSEAHSALYDAERTADLFCLLTNAAQGVFEQLRSPAEEAE